MRQAVDLTHGDIRHRLIKLALPIMGTSFVHMAYSFTDMAWLGRLGSEAVAAVGVVSVLTWIAYSIAYINKTGSEVTVAQSIGAGHTDDVRRYASHNTTMSLYIAGIVGLVYLFLGGSILSFYRLEPDVYRLAVTYLRIIIPGLPCVFLTTALSGIYNASGHSLVPFKISSLGLGLNMILDPLFIFVFGLGTSGAGWATLISQAAVLLLFVYQLRRDRLFDSFPLFIRLERRYVLRILRIGGPVAVLNSLFAFVSMYMGRLASMAAAQTGVPSHIGVATLTTGGQLEGITWNTSQGFATALASVVGQNYAAGKMKRVFRAYRYTLLYTSLFGLLGTILFVGFGTEVFSLIVPERAAYVEGGLYLRISGFSQLLMMAEIATQGLFYGTGRTVPPALISIVGNYLRIPLAYWAITYGLGLEGLWWIVSSTAMLKGTVAIIWMFFLRKRLLREEKTAKSAHTSSL